MYLFLQAVLATLRARGQETDGLLRETLVGWRDRFPKIRDLPGEEARLDAARRLLFGDLGTTEVQRTTDGLQFSLQTCPLAPRALEYGDPCCVARALIGSLVGPGGRTVAIPAALFTFAPKMPGSPAFKTSRPAPETLR